MTKFKNLGLNDEIVKSLTELGFIEPSPIQEQGIPFILKSEKDLIALAQTGTGKTAAYGLPILNLIDVNKKKLQAIILCPTRELCLQISQDLIKMAKHSKGIAVSAVYGGERIDLQINSLKRGSNIVVGTPGRVKDLIRRKVLKLDSIKWLVLDEADEMLDMGFKEDLDSILGETPKSRQTLLFSATMSRSVASIAKNYMHDTEEISIGEKNTGAENVSHEYYIVQARDRFEALRRILDCLPDVYGILFCRTRNETQEIADKLKQAGYDAEALHGEITQAMRTKIMARFKQKQIRLLVATDVAARGIDVNDLTHVINYNLPDQYESYTHRSGRTGRASKSGKCLTILSPREAGAVKRLEAIIGKSFTRKDVPKGDDVLLSRVNAFMEEIEKSEIEDIGKEKFFSEIVERLKKHSKEDLIKRFFANKFGAFLTEEKSEKDLNAKAGKAVADKPMIENGANFKINLGRKHGFEVKEFFGLINSNPKLKGLDIGRVVINPEFSLFSVEKKSAENVIKFLPKSVFRGRKIELSRAGFIPPKGGRRGGFKNRKGGFRR